MKTFLESQKNSWTSSAKRNWSKKEEPGLHPEAEGSVDLIGMAKKGVDSFVDAQKHLLDLASEQVDVNVKFAKEILTIRRDETPATSLSDLDAEERGQFCRGAKGAGGTGVEAASEGEEDLKSRPR